MTQIVPVIQQTIASFVASANLNSASKSQTELTRLALEAFKLYIPWIDVAFSANPEFLNAAFALLSTELRPEAIDCVFAIVAKGMDPLVKINLLESLQLINIFQLCANVNGNCAHCAQIARKSYTNRTHIAHKLRTNRTQIVHKSYTY